MTNTNTKTNNFRVEQAGQQHFEILVDFNLRHALETENKHLDEVRLRKSMQAIVSDERKGVYLLAIDGEEVLGMIMYNFEWSTWRNANFMWLTDLYVRPEYRKCGVFKLLANYAMAMYHNREDIIGLRFCVDKSNSVNVKAAYESFGWKESNYNLWEMKKNVI